MDEKILDGFRLTVLEKGLTVYGIHVYVEGQPPLSYRFRSDDRECLYSGSKTFSSVGVGICVDEGRFALSDFVLDFFPEYKAVAAAGSEKITLRDLLHMAAGKRDVMLPAFKVGETTDWAEFFFRDPLYSDPGAEFYYSNNCTYMLGRVVEKVTGLTLRDYLIPRLFNVLDIYNPQWETCPNGHTVAATGLYLTTEEFARLGRLLLDGGVYNGKRVVSEDYLKNAITDLIDTVKFNNNDRNTKCGYGYQLWRCPFENAYRADGLYGQFSLVFPNDKAVITVTSHEEKNTYEILESIYRDIIPRLRNCSLN